MLDDTDTDSLRTTTNELVATTVLLLLLLAFIAAQYQKSMFVRYLVVPLAVFGTLLAVEAGGEMHTFADERRRRQPAVVAATPPWQRAREDAPRVLACPDTLIHAADGRFYLYNTHAPIHAPGTSLVATNPTVFLSLSEYLQYWRESKRRGSECPVAYLQEQEQEQGTPNPAFYEVGLEQELREAAWIDSSGAGLVAERLPPSTQMARPVVAAELAPQDLSSTWTVAPHDPLSANQNQGRWTPDKEHASNDSALGGFPVTADQAQTGLGAGAPGISSNPMDSNWGGGEYTTALQNELFFLHAGER